MAQVNNNMPQKYITLNIIRKDPYFGFQYNNSIDLEIYEKIHNKGYKCLSQYLGSKQIMTVLCPYGHICKGYPRKITIPCNNCQICWNNIDLTPAEKLAEIITSRSGKQLTSYILCKTKVSIRCENGHIFESIPNDIMSGKWCKMCSKNNVDNAKEKFYSILQADGSRALTPYVNSIIPVEIICKMGHIYQQAPNSTNMGHKCKFCMGNAKEIGEEHFKQAVTLKGGQILGKYINRNVKVNILCSHGHVFCTFPSYVTNGQWCKKCVNRCPEQSREKFIRTVNGQNGKILGEYINFHTKVTIECEMKHIFDITPKGISEGKWCSACRNCCPIQARQRFEEVVNNKHGIIIGDYINTSTKLSIRCENNHIFDIKPNNVTNGKWCRLCGLSESNGERLIRQHLIDRNIQFQKEVIFGWMPKKRYDYCFSHNGKQYIVEFDGIQHFVQIEFFTPTEELFVERRNVDIIKTKAVLANGHYMIRIAYSDINNINEIIDNYIDDNTPKSNLMVSNAEEYDWLIESVEISTK